VVLNALDAAERGATVLTRTRCVARVQRGAEGWRPRCSRPRGRARCARARWSTPPAPGRRSTLREQAVRPRSKRATPAPGQGQPHRGARLFDHDHAYIFQNPDKRIIFAIPYEGDFTLIGTTDVEHHGAPDAARIDADEIAYLCEQASRYFAQPVTRPTWSGLCRRAPAARRRLGRRRRPSPATTCSSSTSASRPRAAAHGLGRQDHHLPQAGRRGGRRLLHQAGPALQRGPAAELARHGHRQRTVALQAAIVTGVPSNHCCSQRRSRCKAIVTNHCWRVGGGSAGGVVLAQRAPRDAAAAPCRKRRGPRRPKAGSTAACGAKVSWARPEAQGSARFNHA
jgi:hypothetical protein